jgi:hypothetical protein
MTPRMDRSQGHTVRKRIGSQASSAEIQYSACRFLSWKKCVLSLTGSTKEKAKV